MEGDRDTERQRRGHRVRQGETEMHAVRQTEEARVGTAVSQTQRGARRRGPEASAESRTEAQRDTRTVICREGGRDRRRHRHTQKGDEKQRD